jgi:hypothetical protein
MDVSEKPAASVFMVVQHPSTHLNVLDILPIL